MTKISLAHKDKDPGPEKLHLPDEETCPRGHEVVSDDGHPTDNMAWDHEGNPKCASCEGPDWEILKMVMQDNGITADTCPNGHPLTPDTVNYKMRDDDKGRHHADIYCKKCGALVPGEEKVSKAIKFDAAKHGKFNPATDTPYAKYAPEVQRFYTDAAEKHRRRARDVQVDFEPNHPLATGESNYNVHDIIDRGVKAGVLKDGDNLSFDHFVPLGMGGSHSPDNLVGMELKLNTDRRDSMPSTFEAKKFGMEHYIPLLHVLNPQNVGWMDDEGKYTGNGYFRKDDGTLDTSKGRDGNGINPRTSDKGTGTLSGNMFKRNSSVPKRLYTREGTAGGMQPTKGGEIYRGFMSRGVTALPDAAAGKGGLNTLGIIGFKPHKNASDERATYIEPHHPGDQKLGTMISSHEFGAKGKEKGAGDRNANVQAHLNALVDRIGPIPGFDHSERGNALFHHRIDQNGGVETFMHPAVKAAMVNYVHQEGAKRALPSAIAESHAPILGRASGLKVAPEHEANYINTLEQHTGKINFGTQPRALFVDHPTDTTQGKVINPAIRRHVREYTRSQGGLRVARSVQLTLSEQRPVTLRKANKNGRVASVVGNHDNRRNINNGVGVYVGQSRVHQS
jgi:hypothetical protein